MGGRPSDDEVKDEPEDDMLSLNAVVGDLTDRAVGTCHDTATTGRDQENGMANGRSARAPLFGEVPIIGFSKLWYKALEWTCCDRV